MKRILILFVLCALEAFGMKSDNTNSKEIAQILTPEKVLYYTIKGIVDCKANLNDFYFQNRTLFTQAAYLNYFHVCTLLLEHGADINARDNFGNTPLITAAQYNKIEMCKFLLDHGANPNIAGSYGMTALMYFADLGNLQGCILLVQYGADPACKDNDGATALDSALLGNDFNDNMDEGDEDDETITLTEEHERDYQAVIDLLTNPDLIRSTVMAPDNPKRNQYYKKQTNIFNTLFEQEIGQ